MACKLVPIPGTRDFEAKVGENVTLVTADPAKVLFETAEYAGGELMTAGQACNSLQLKVVPGSNFVNIVFVFAPGTSAGELRENGGTDSQTIRRLTHTDPFKSFCIIGKTQS